MENFWSLFGVLAAVLLILFFAYYATRWIGTHSMQGSPAAFRAGGTGGFRLVAQLSVGRNERLVLVRLDERCYLLGVTEHRITLLRELDGEEAAKWLETGAAAPAKGFADILGERARKKK